MSTRRSMTRDIHESIRLALGAKAKILLKCPVKQDSGGGVKAGSDRILVFTAHRLFIMTAKVPARIDHHFHYLDVKSVESKGPRSVAFTFHGDKSTYNFRPATAADADVDEMIAVLVSAVRRVFPGVPLEHLLGRVELSPPERMSAAGESAAWKSPDPKLIGPCGGFSAQYASMCDYYSLPFREEVAWDVDTIYFSHDSREMNLQDFEHLDTRDVACILSSLEHNTWFNKIRVAAGGGGGHGGGSGSGSHGGAKLPAELCDRIVQVAAKSVSLQELHVSTIGARWEFAARLAQALTSNPCCALASFDLSCNFVEDKGIAQLSAAVAKMPKGLRHVNLSYCSLSHKGLIGFSQALVSNRQTASTLTYLNIAGNTMKEESCHALCTFLAQPNVVAILDISATDTPIDIMFGALVRGCATSLTHLNLSRNPFSATKKNKEIPAAFKQFFAGTLVLQYINMSHCKAPAEAIKHLLLGLACNENTTNVELNLSNNGLCANGATVLENCVGTVRCVAKLDLSDNGIEAEMAGVMQGVAKNKTLLSLNVSKNMTNVKPKHFPAVVESIVQLVQEEDSQLQKLNMSDCRLKGEMSNVINALGSNQCLQHLDLSGNGMGDAGARLLAKALQINTRLKIINLDRNGITLTGLADIAYALQSNYALRHIPFPTFDLQPFVKTHPERVDALVHRIQELLQRNASPHRFRNTAQAFRLTQGFMLTSIQQNLDRVAAQAHDSMLALKKMNPDVSAENSAELRHAEGMMTDAENSKHLLSSLHEVTAKRANEVDRKLKQVSMELTNFVTSHVQHNADAMISCADSQCSTVMNSNDAKTKTDLKRNAQKRCTVPPDFLSALIMDQLGQEIHNKINELNLIIANSISDRVIDEVIEGMNRTNRTLVSEVGSLKKKRSLTPDHVLKTRSSSGSVSETISLDETGSGSQKSESCSPLGTPQTSKKTLQGRKLRPKSVMDREGGASPAATTDLPAASAASESQKKEEDAVPELPSSTALQHLGKARPKRSKRHAPSRGAVVSVQLADGVKVDEDEAVAKFYTSPNSSFSPGSTPSGSPMLQDHKPSRLTNNGALSREDLRVPSPAGRKTPVGSPEFGRKSPVPPPKPTAASQPERQKSSSGLSCLASTAADEDDDKKEKTTGRTLSPMLTSAISDIFSKASPVGAGGGIPSSATASKSLAAKSASDAVAKSPGTGASPFAMRRTGDSSLSDLSTKRRSVADDAEEKDEGKGAAVLTPEEVLKRHGVGTHGGNSGMLMAEMREKRASMAPKADLGSADTTSPPKPSGGEAEAKNLFGQVKLRSTGLAGSLTSPTSEVGPSSTEESASLVAGGGVPATSPTAKGGSIVGLRATKFSTSRPSSNLPSLPPSDSAADPPVVAGVPKPKPLPKPRPWSIVGVDRKSGEMTSVIKSSADAANSGAAPEQQDTTKVTTAKTTSTTTTSATSSSIAAPVAAPRKSSVRDLINNMNRAGGDKAGEGKSAETTPTADVFRRKGNSLPRGTTPPAAAASTDDKSATTTGSSSSPRVAAKAAESTSDDPRILKLDDDFAYDEVLDV